MLETLLDDIKAARQDKMCTFGAFLSELDKKDRERIEAILAMPAKEVSGSEIATALRVHVKVSPQTVSRHRRRAGGNGCACP